MSYEQLQDDTTQHQKYPKEHRQKLHQALMNISGMDVVSEGCLGWHQAAIYLTAQPHTCPCGCHPIHELNLMRYSRNHQTIVVGTCCVAEFKSRLSEQMLLDIRDMNASGNGFLSDDAIVYGRQRLWVDEWEEKFYKSITKEPRTPDEIRRRNKYGYRLSARQLEIRNRINLSFLYGLGRATYSFTKSPLDHPETWLSNLRPLDPYAFADTRPEPSKE